MTLLLAPVASGPPILDRVHHCDLFTLASTLPPQSVDMILTDLPYGTTACSWDEIIPFEPMWAAFKRVIKPRGAIVLTASQPFTARLVCSNLQGFSHSWIWNKGIAANYLNANRQPLKRHEDILVFGVKAPLYYPQMSIGQPYAARSSSSGGVIRDKTVAGHLTVNNGQRYPDTILSFNSVANTIHPTQKPVPLFEYLIKTYTKEGELVVDFCSGSGTTAIAAHNTGRRFVCCDNGTDEHTGKTWAQIATERLRNTDPMQSRTVAAGIVQRSLFEAVM